MLRIGFVLIALMTIISCGDSQTKTNDNSGQSAFDGAVAMKPDGEANTVAGVTFVPPSDWTNNGPSGMRKAEYTLGPVEGEDEAAVMTVFYFGQNQGGDVNSNLSRWIGQVSMPGGGSVAESAVKRNFTAGDMPVSTVEVAGTFASSMGGPMSGKSVAKENYRLYGAVVEGPQGNVFFKLTGPDKTALAMAEGFANMIHTVEKAAEQPTETMH